MGMTIKDIAKKCGVGVSTVSRALNNHPDINPQTKEMILKAVEQNGFVPNNSARNLKRTDSKTIAIIVKDIDNPFFATMMKIMEQEIHRLIHFLFTMWEKSRMKWMLHLNLLLRKGSEELFFWEAILKDKRSGLHGSRSLL